MLWILFGAVVVTLLALDLGLFHRRDHIISTKEALGWSCFWIACGCSFGLVVSFLRGADAGLDYFSGYLLEKSMSVDNLFVFVLIFGALNIPRELQHRVLYWGVIGALATRAALIFTGAALLEHFGWLTYVFGGFLAYTGTKLGLSKSGESEAPDESEGASVIKWVGKVLPTTPQLSGNHFVVRANDRTRATPLLLALVAIEISDMIFSLDSIPAVFGVTRDPMIVFTSNVFAMLGLRSLFFLLASWVDRLVYLKMGLAVVLAFVGGKMLLADWVRVPALLSLGVIVAVLTVTTVTSLVHSRKKAAKLETLARS
jgi:tellurite resistance protein TerC